jgi:AGZA family xanthine/uracil permease-like MFS transporter
VVLIGSFMLAELRRVSWGDVTEAVPAFLTLTVMPFTFNIAHGVAAGIVSFALMKGAAGRRREVPGLMWALAVLVVLAYLALPRLRH